jgi:peptide subunit release factor 1 (eRF1)
VVDRNMKDSVDFAVHFFEENRVRRVMIGGTDENVSLFRSLMPKSWQSLVMKSFSMPMTASNIDVRKAAMEIATDSTREAEFHLVESLITGAAKANGAVAGMADTYDAINRDRVKTLVFVDNLRRESFVCSHCGALYPSKVDETCPLCGNGKLERTLDGIELAVNSVMRHGGDVNVVHATPALEQVEGIGALLRY